MGFERGEFSAIHGLRSRHRRSGHGSGNDESGLSLSSLVLDFDLNVVVRFVLCALLFYEVELIFCLSVESELSSLGYVRVACACSG